MFGLLAWSWTWDVTPGNVLLAWLGWCALVRLNALSMDTGPPRVRCYVLALVPAASPYLVALLVFGIWAPLAG